MQKISSIIILFISLFFISFSIPNKSTSEYDIEGIYSAIEPSGSTMVLTENDNIEKAKLILVPTTITKGNYAVSVTRKGSNLYKIDGKDIYIQTRYCYEYSYSQDAFLKIEGQYGYSKGKIIF